MNHFHHPMDLTQLAAVTWVVALGKKKHTSPAAERRSHLHETSFLDRQPGVRSIARRFSSLSPHRICRTDQPTNFPIDFISNTSLRGTPADRIEDFFACNIGIGDFFVFNSIMPLAGAR